MKDFNLHQLHVANRLGVSEERVREKRGALQEGIDWRKSGNRIVYAPHAVEKLAKAFAVPALPKETRLLLEWKEHRLVVVRLWSNPIFVAARLWDGRETGQKGFGVVPEEGQLMRVRVKGNGNLVRGMVLRCIHLGNDLYEALELPRRKGRW